MKDLMQYEIKDNDIANKERESNYKPEDIKTTAQYMMDSLGNDVVVPEQSTVGSNSFVIRHIMTQDMDLTTFLVWMQIASPLLAGIIVHNGFLDAIGLGFINVYIMLIILDAIFGIADVIVLYKHNFNVLKYVVWSVWLPPVYMLKRKKLLGEKNYQHIAWILSFLVLVWMS